jgi:hypothetical protein
MTSRPMRRFPPRTFSRTRPRVGTQRFSRSASRHPRPHHHKQRSQQADTPYWPTDRRRPIIASRIDHRPRPTEPNDPHEAPSLEPNEQMTGVLSNRKTPDGSLASHWTDRHPRRAPEPTLACPAPHIYAPQNAGRSCEQTSECLRGRRPTRHPTRRSSPSDRQPALRHGAGLLRRRADGRANSRLPPVHIHDAQRPRIRKIELRPRQLRRVLHLLRTALARPSPRK